MHKLSFNLFFFIVLMQGTFFAQEDCLSSKRVHFNRLPKLFQRSIMKPNLINRLCNSQSFKYFFPEVSGNNTGNGHTQYPFSVHVTFSQRNVPSDDENHVDFGLKKMDQYELRQTLLDILGEFMENSGEVKIRIRHTGEYGFFELFVRTARYFYKNPLGTYPESAFDGDGNLSFWQYYDPHLTYSFNAGSGPGGSGPSGLKGGEGYQNNMKNRYVANLVNFMFTWVEQDEKWVDTIPLSPASDVELKIFVEADAIDNSISRSRSRHLNVYFIRCRHERRKKESIVYRCGSAGSRPGGERP